jgi:hypothetical protein
MFTFGYRPALWQRLALGASADGRLEAVIHEAVGETSRFEDYTERQGYFGAVPETGTLAGAAGCSALEDRDGGAADDGPDSQPRAGTDPVSYGPLFHATSDFEADHVPGAHTERSVAQPLASVATANPMASARHGPRCRRTSRIEPVSTIIRYLEPIALWFQTSTEPWLTGARSFTGAGSPARQNR